MKSMSEAEKKLRIANEELRLRLNDVEESLRTQGLLNNIIENSPNALFVTDEHGTLIRMNQACRNLFRLRDSEVIGRYNILDNSYNDDINLKPIIRDVYEKGFTARFVTSIDTAALKSLELAQTIKVDVDVSMSPILEPNGKVMNVVIQLIDITEQMQTVEYLKKRQQRYSSLVKSLNAGVVVHAPDTSIIISNPRASEFLGLTEDQMKGKQSFDPDWKFVNEDNIPIPFEEYPVNRIAKSGQELGNLVIGVNQSKSKDTRWFLVNGIPVKDKNNEIDEIIISFIDITERKLSELELFKAKERAEQSDRLKTAFLANMSHEIRTPMNGILGFTSLLKERRLGGEEQAEFIRLIEKSGVRMLNIINDIIDISKIESGQMDLLIMETDIIEQIEFIYAFFRPEIENKGIKMVLKNLLPAGECIIKTDREKIYAILTNLVKNAVKFTKAGIIELGCEIKGENLEFFVKDTGVGIPKDRQQAIFERFIKADAADLRAFQGAGLGLSISKAYVEMLGGEIWVESETDKGSAFYFTIPMKIKPAETAVQNSDSPVETIKETEPAIPGLKILIAEDDNDSSKYLELITKRFSKLVYRAATGVEAVEICQNNPDIDLVLMDIKMPVMDGYEATRQIRYFNSNVKIIAQTAYALHGDYEKALEAGCNDYTTKPIDKNHLTTLIQRYFLDMAS
jgi:hypothetical protein